MKQVSASVKVGVLVLLVFGSAYAVWQGIGSSPAGSRNYDLWAKFRDASGMPLGSRVVVAGLAVGEIRELSVEGRYARVDFRIREDVQVFSNAVVVKRAASLLGGFYLELDPGSPTSLAADGTEVRNARLVSGDQILQVVEATTADEVMRRVEDIMPNVDAVLLSVRDLSEETRRLMSGPIASVADRVDRLVQEEAVTISRILANTDTAIARLDLITRDIRQVTGGADAKLDRIIANLEEASSEARELMRSARQEVELTGAAAREKLDGVDELLSRSGSVARKIDEDHGTLGRLVNDPAIADNVEEITEDAKSFLGTLFGLKTYVGLRTEYNVFSGMVRNYMSVELATRPDRYYLIEIQKGPRGNYPVITLEYDPTVDRNTWIRRAVIEDKARFTFQFARVFHNTTFRFGLKESSGGIGLDYKTRWWDRGLLLQADLFDAGFDRLPRFKVTAAIEALRYFHILGGIDDALNTPGELVIDAGDFDIPTTFDRLRFGRDYFFGAMIRFTDEDLTALLAVGGAALMSAAAD